jgi:hypothetical protein
MEPHNNLLCLLQHFSKALCQPGGLRRERTLRVEDVCFSYDGADRDYVLEQTARIR